MRSFKPLFVVIAIGSVASLLPTFSVPANAQVPVAQQSPSMNFSPIPGYRLEANKKPNASARFFHSPGRSAVLVHDLTADIAYEISSRTGRVNVHPASNYLALDNGELEFISGKGPSGHVPLKVVGGRPMFTHDGLEYLVADKPSLLGPQTAASIQADDSYYKQAASKYTPTPQYINALRTYPKKTEIKIFFGSWCQNCHKWLPNIIRVANELGDTNISFEYHGLPKGMADPLAARLKVSSVPFGIFMQDGKEIGRISGPSWRFPDLQLFRLLDP